MDLIDLICLRFVSLFKMEYTIEHSHYDSILLLLFAVFDDHTAILNAYGSFNLIISIVDFENLIFKILTIEYFDFIYFPFIFFIIN